MTLSLAAMVDKFRKRILERRPLQIRGGGSKDFYGGPIGGDVLSVAAYRGIVSYEPSELVITARSGTPLADIESALAARRQFLAFEPPAFGGQATVGGVLAAGLSGPRRMSVGAVRDFVLGVRLLDGEGRDMKFGGEVMKNVAGYDVSRLMAGSLGTLGVILEVSFKVLPQPVAEMTLRVDLSQKQALKRMNQWGGQALPISASCWADQALTLRLSGAAAAVRTARTTLGGDVVSDIDALSFWSSIREQRHAFFADAAQDLTLWRLSLPSVAAPLDLPGPCLIEWGGAQRWLHGMADPTQIQTLAAKVGGGATAFRRGIRNQGVFQPLTPTILALHQRLKQRFDPHGVFGPGRLFPEL